MSDADPTLAAMSAAAEAARQANHAAYGAPRTTASVYDRTGALHDLLCKVEQLAQVLSEQVAGMPSGPLYSTDDTTPGEHLLDAADLLTQAARAVNVAVHHVNNAWSELSPIGTRDPSD